MSSKSDLDWELERLIAAIKARVAVLLSKSHGNGVGVDGEKISSRLAGGNFPRQAPDLSSLDSTRRSADPGKDTFSLLRTLSTIAATFRMWVRRLIVR